MGQFDAMVESAVNEANSEQEAPESASVPDAGAVESPENVAAPVEASAPAPTPSAPSWNPPSRDEWERTQQLLTMASQFNPERMREVFAPKQAPAPAQVAPEDRDYETYFGSQAGWTKFWSEMRQDPKVLERGISAIVARNRKDDFASLKALKDEFASYRQQVEQELQGMRGFQKIAEHRFASNPRWDKYGSKVAELFQSGALNPQAENAIELAFQHAEAIAKSQGATPAQAAQAGAQAAKAVAAQAPKQKPTPRDEPSLREGKRPAKGPDKDSDTEAARGKRLTNPRYFTELATQAVRKAAAGAMQ